MFALRLFSRSASREPSASHVTPNPFLDQNFNSVWKTADADSSTPQASALDADALYEMCVAEEKTLQILEEEDLCYKCPVEGSEPRCLQPVSLVAFARVFLTFLDGNFDAGNLDDMLVPPITCEMLRDRWTPVLQGYFTSMITSCTNYMLEWYGDKPLEDGKYSQCLDERIRTATVVSFRDCVDFGLSSVPFSPIVPRDSPLQVDDQFLLTGKVRYTSSIYATKSDADSAQRMFDLDQAGRFPSSGREGSPFEQVYYELTVNSMYTTIKVGFYERSINMLFPMDVAISTAALVITSSCILFHTRSPFITLLGLSQIMFAIPVAYFVYYWFCGFPL